MISKFPSTNLFIYIIFIYIYIYISIFTSPNFVDSQKYSLMRNEGLAFKVKRKAFTKPLNFRVKVCARSRALEKLGFNWKIVGFSFHGQEKDMRKTLTKPLNFRVRV